MTKWRFFIKAPYLSDFIEFILLQSINFFAAKSLKMKLLIDICNIGCAGCIYSIRSKCMLLCRIYLSLRQVGQISYVNVFETLHFETESERRFNLDEFCFDMQFLTLFLDPYYKYSTQLQINEIDMLKDNYLRVKQLIKRVKIFRNTIPEE